MERRWVSKEAGPGFNSPVPVPFRLPVRTGPYGTCIVEDRSAQVRTTQYLMFIMAGLTLITGLGVISFWHDPSAAVLVVKSVIVLPLDLFAVGFFFWLGWKESSETRGLRFDPAKDELQILTVGTPGDLRSSTCAPVSRCSLALHPVALDVQGFTWKGFALVADLGADSIVLACRKEREQIAHDLPHLPEWCRRFLLANDGALLTGPAADVRLGGSDD